MKIFSFLSTSTRIVKQAAKEIKDFSRVNQVKTFDSKGIKTVIGYTEDSKPIHLFRLNKDGTRMYKTYSNKHYNLPIPIYSKTTNTVIMDDKGTPQKQISRVSTFINDQLDEYTRGVCYPNGDYYNITLQGGKIKDVNKKINGVTYSRAQTKASSGISK